MYANSAAASPLSLPFSSGRRSHRPTAETSFLSPLFSLHTVAIYTTSGLFASFRETAQARSARSTDGKSASESQLMSKDDEAQTPSSDLGDSDESEDEALDSDDEVSASAREAERLRVLEAAGLLKKPSASDAASPKRRARRPPPARPNRRPGSTLAAEPQSIAQGDSDAEEDQLPAPEEQEERIEDAYDLYQRAMREHEVAPPLDTPAAQTSVLSDFDSQGYTSAPSTPSLLSATTVGSNLKDTWHATTSGLFNRRSRSSTVGEKSRPVISSPVVAQEGATDVDNRASGAFGSVSRLTA